MNRNDSSAGKDISAALCGLYGSFGYARYKMNKFEEYDLYARNKDFLVADRVVTFTDTNGKLMALKPDVTLSIAKNCRDVPGEVNKLYYDENVYRVSKGANAFREIRQLGVECTGEVDDYCILEVLTLALSSLKAISGEYALDVSELSVLGELLDGCGLTSSQKREALRLVGEKNLHETETLCRAAGIDEQTADVLKTLITSYGKPAEVLPALKALLPQSAGLARLERLTEALGDDVVRVDFSLVSDMSYYNGVVFKGYVGNIPESVISGGQYDRLMEKMRHTSRAVGFAVYLDLLEEFSFSETEYDADALLLYGDANDPADVMRAARKLVGEGKRVCVRRNAPEKLRCREIIDLTEGGAVHG
ncbi:MAG: ATP phosphoribosyltransferase regulatory subunit [Clostridia bacterium]|nr:ATP phosphoribosyltransferase regulatory subunit [Clostridia bacterium]